MPSPSASSGLSAWLGTLGLQQYEGAFQSNDISFDLLPEITSDDLRDIGVTSVGHRRVLLQAIAALAQPPAGSLAHEQASHGIAAPAPVAVAAPAMGPPTVAPPANGMPSVSNHQHRLLTVMFCDLVGSTELSGRLDAEDLQALMQAYRECIRTVVHKHKGYIAQYLGDGVLVYFGYPSISESDCERALRCAPSSGWHPSQGCNCWCVWAWPLARWSLVNW